MTGPGETAAAAPKGECRSSQAKGSDHDDTPKSAACPHAEGATRSGGESLRYKNGGAKLPKAVLRLFVRPKRFRSVSKAPPRPVHDASGMCPAAGQTKQTEQNKRNKQRNKHDKEEGT